jgi:hypothetical protein
MMRLPLFGIASVVIGILMAPAEVSAKKSGSGQVSDKVKEPAKIEQPNIARTTAKTKGKKGQTKYITIKMDNPTIRVGRSIQVSLRDHIGPVGLLLAIECSS